jgi:hypothetical protein
MAKKRSAREQVISGLRIGGLLVLSFVFFGAMVLSASLITDREATPKVAYLLLGTLAQGILASILFLTVHHWTKWLIGILGYGLFRLVGAVIFGPYLTHPVSRLQIASWMLYLAVSLLLTKRHIRRRPKGAERLGLTGFVLCVPFALSLESPKPLFLGLLLLALGELIETARLWNRGRHRPPSDNQPIVPA